MARANENANAQGNCDLNLTFMAFKRAEASSPIGHPTRTQSRNSSGDGSQETPHCGISHLVHIFHLVLLAVGQSHLKLLFADGHFFHLFLRGTGEAGSTMLGFRIIPSNITRCV